VKTPAIVALKDANDGFGKPALVLWWAILIGGLALRVDIYLCKRSLWLDEAMLAVNLQTHTFAELFGRLDDMQVAPPLFLLISKFVCSVWGQVEYALRLLPLVSGCAALYLFARLVKRIGPRFFGPCALAVLAFGFLHIDWATSFKQYATDELSTVLVICAAVFWDRLSTLKRYIVAASVPALLWLSYPSAFVLLGLLCVGVISAARKKDRAVRGALAVLALSLVISSTLLYLVAVQHSVGHEGMAVYWADGFPSPPFWGWFAGSMIRVLSWSSGIPSGPLLGSLMCIWGAYALMKSKHKSVAFLAIGTLISALVASFLRFYPFLHARVCGYWGPLALLLLAFGFDAAHRALQPQSVARWVKIVGVLAVVVAVYGLVHDREGLVARQEMRSVTAALRQRVADDVPLLVSAQASAAFRVYGGDLLKRRIGWLVDWRLTAKQVYEVWISVGCPEAFWLVLSHSDFHMTDDVFAALSPFCVVQDTVMSHGSGAYLIKNLSDPRDKHRSYRDESR